MSAIANPRPSSRLTYDERMAALRSAGAGYFAPLYKVGDAVTFDGRASRVQDVQRAESGAYVLTIAVPGGSALVAETHPDLVAR